VNLGYACINMSLPGGFKTCRLDSVHLNGIDFVKKITEHNFKRLRDIIKWNIEHDIRLYRLSSELIPFGSHEVLKDWLWWEEENLCLIAQEVRDLVFANNLRITIHPWQGDNLSSPHRDVLLRTFADIHFQTNLLNMFGGTDMILHVGGRHEGKVNSMQRFRKHFNYLSDTTRKVLRIENDDKVYTVADVFELCDQLQLNPLYDFHHDLCAPSIPTLEIKAGLTRFWHNTRMKFHLSTGQRERLDRSHADYISKDTWEEFLSYFGDWDVDVMLECKAKELAIFRIREYEKEVIS